MPGEFMTIEEAARFLNMSQEAVELIVEKGFTRKAENGKLLVKTAEIRDWLHRGMQDFDSAQLDKLSRDYGKRYRLIHPLLDPSCIKTKLIGTSKAAVISELVDLLIERGGVNAKHRGAVLAAIIERERMCSTALTDGVAIPHPREPLKGIIKKPRLVIGLSWRGIDFESFDGRPTHVVVLLCTPGLDAHLQILARLTRLLRNPKMRVALCRSKSAEEAADTFAAFEKASG